MNYNKKWKMIDLSQEIYEGNSLYPIHQPTFIFVNKTHKQSQDATGSRLGFSARNLLMSEHCATHSDAVWEYVPGALPLTTSRLSLPAGHPGLHTSLTRRWI